jgi:tripartite ATP-independent transporter DctP family solute receptor
MADRLAELSGGTMRVQIFPNGQLGGERETAELLQLGSIDITKVASSVIENFVPGMAVYSLPYLFDDSDHYWSVFQSDLGQSILRDGERYWMRGLCYYDAGFRSFIIHGRRVEAPEDLRGLKIRVMPSNLQIQTINALGGHATPMSIGELYTALQSGVVDGADGNPPTLFQTKLFEVSDYYILDEHSAPPDVMLISTHTWNDLTDHQRAWLEQAVDESVERQRELWEESTDLALEAMRETGLEIVYPDKEPFRRAVQSMYERLEGTEMGLLAQEIQSMNVGDVPRSDYPGSDEVNVPAASMEEETTMDSMMSVEGVEIRGARNTDSGGDRPSGGSIK